MAVVARKAAGAVTRELPVVRCLVVAYAAIEAAKHVGAVCGHIAVVAHCLCTRHRVEQDGWTGGSAVHGWLRHILLPCLCTHTTRSTACGPCAPRQLAVDRALLDDARLRICGVAGTSAHTPLTRAVAEGHAISAYAGRARPPCTPARPEVRHT